MKTKTLLSILVLFAAINSFAQVATPQKITLLFAGDVMMHDSQLAAAKQPNADAYNFEPAFALIKPLIEKYDLAFANLETTLGIKPYKGYPNFSSPPQLAVELQRTGFDVLVTANNHSVDKLGKGIDKTIEVLDSLGIPHTGTFINPAVRDTTYPLLIEHNGFRLALLNYTYGTNGIAIPAPRVVNLIDTLQIQADIDKAIKLAPDMVIAMMHWGDEYKESPNTVQQKLATMMTQRGVNLVIGSHPHVLQPMTWTRDSIQNHLVVYSLGNFISGQRTIPRDGAAVVGVELTKTLNNCEISDVHYHLTYVHYPVIGGIRHFMVVPVSLVETTPEMPAPGGAGWGRLWNYAVGARAVMKKNINVPEKIND
ncbi:poly-gamma-glutamate synthesis protein (capsule biosynthesis protein) [Breznakibacter xylanolyticus]|uniref:Poly-gamma-glutamate synthesis protein (Capsule biosynthesis protein) n=1 Tax=Breznakibacter xylanolyticus TaxID=990 RepID=A0A2W7NVM1_9BACT|nr:CapA family protein [Breznakibacter xylanolyticus]PZX20674.1 poly-gamma-glutamate synthesis protein (capsule biosynthesis protein) [Breznakibacter xylanolyticus]